MNKQLQKLYNAGLKKERTIIGLMSGTSLDGLDIVLCYIKGSGMGTSIRVVAFETVPYTESIRNKIRRIFANRNGALQDVCFLHKWIAVEHSKMITNMMLKWKISKDEIDLIASHGQTIFHAPGENFEGENINSTLQIVDGDHVAQLTGIITISDFRQKHIAAGGEGAPLALYGDYILFGNSNNDTVLLNIGGIANFTFISSDNKNIICSDIGPGNTLMDVWMQHYYHEQFDKNGELALSGKVNISLLKILSEHPFLQKSFPRTCGQEIFNLQFIEESLRKLPSVPAEDMMATLNKFTADCIVNAIGKITSSTFDLYISGGGIHNTVLTGHLQQSLLLANFCEITSKGFSADAKEAVLFAILANETVAGDVAVFKNSGIFPAVSFGKISFPD